MELFLKPLTEILVRRSSDKVATVRAKAIASIASFIQHVNGKAHDEDGKPNSELLSFVMQSFAHSGNSPSNSPEQTEKHQNNGVLDFLRRRTQGHVHLIACWC